MATARKLPSGNYRCRVYLGKVNGKDAYKSFTAPTKKEAERIKEEKEISDENSIKMAEAVISPCKLSKKMVI